MERTRFSTRARFKSFSYAWDGLRSALRTEHNTWIHLALTLAAAALGVALSISRGEWVALVIVIVQVWVAELFNTAIEKTMDFISTERIPAIGRIKDMAAAAVLLTALSALAVGGLIFIPKLF